MKKPDRAIFVYTLDRLNKTLNANISPDEVMMIGNDHNKDIIPALNLGMQARLIDRTKQNLEDVI